MSDKKTPPSGPKELGGNARVVTTMAHPRYDSMGGRIVEGGMSARPIAGVGPVVGAGKTLVSSTPASPAAPASAAPQATAGKATPKG